MKKAALALGPALVLLVTLWAWEVSRAPGPPLEGRLHDLGRLAGLLGFAALAFQVLLSARVPALERGIGLDRLLRWHGGNGLLTGTLLLAHPLLLTVSERVGGYSPPFGPAKAMGLLTLVLLLTGAVAGIALRRGLPGHETWLSFHRLGFLVFPLGFVHGMAFGATPGRVPLAPLWGLLLLAYLWVLFHKAWRLRDLRRHPYRLVSVTSEGPEVRSLAFEGRPLAFNPGQFCFLRLVEGSGIGKRGETHPFTLVSHPAEPRLSMTIKASGDFTSALHGLGPGAEILLDGPYGVFCPLNFPPGPRVFVAGGIGITPFLSVLRHVRHRGLPGEITLFWANRRARDLFALGELEALSEAQAGIRVVPVLSREPGWQGERGHLTPAMIGRYVANPAGARWFLCGPPPMMQSVRRVLRGMGVPGGRIHWERFSL